MKHSLRLKIQTALTAVLLIVLTLARPLPSRAGGTWSSLVNGPPVGVNNTLLLSDGTVLGMNGAGQCVKLTPDIHGSYINGTWTQVATMNYTRMFFATQLLTNGLVFVAGGEYGTGNTNAEIYDPVANTWTMAPNTPPGGLNNFLDAISEILPNGNVIVAPVGPSVYGGTLIWNTASNTWTPGPALYRGSSQDEAGWVKLPDNSILTIDPFGQNSERYIPALNQWVNDGTVPVPMYGYGGELGAGILLPNGKAFYIGGTNNTAIYTPTGTSSPGTWTAGPVIPNNLGAVDAPAAMMVNGKILCDLGPDTGFNGPCSFYEYDYLANTFTQVNAPGGGSTYNSVPFANSMLDLPDGTVLYVGGQNSGSLYVYTPDGTPLPAGKPVINSITENLDGSYQLTGTGLNGLTEGAAYGDDEQMNGNYPLVRLTNNVTGNVYYARTHDWNSTSVQTGSRVVTAKFSVPQNLPVGNYSLVVVAVGNASAAQTFTVYTPPPAPTGLIGSAGNAQNTLSWNPVAGATSYNVKRLTTLNPPFYTTLATVTGTAATNSGLVNGMNYFYAVSTVSTNGESTNSAPLLLVPVGPPAVPTNVTATIIPQLFTVAPQINLAWSAAYGATNYNVKRATVHGGPYTTIAGAANSPVADTNVVFNKTYYYVVSAVSAGGESVNSVEVNANVQQLTNVCLPVTAVDVAGSQVTFMAAFNGVNFSYQWQKISGGVPSNISGATNSTLTLTNLQSTDAASYKLLATNSVGGLSSSTTSSLTVNSAPTAVNNIITAYAAQTGDGNVNGYTNFVPTWTVAPGSLISGQAPSSVGSGDFAAPGFETAGTVAVLTDGTFGWLNYYPNVGTSPAQVTCGPNAGQSVIYTLNSSATNYALTNITVYGGWGDAGRDQQAYTIYYSTIAAPTNFIQLSVVNYNPSDPAAVQSATRATLTAASGALATNVAAVKFDFTSPAGENGFCGYSEIDLFGFIPATSPTSLVLVSNTVPVTALDVVGSQVTFMAAFASTNPITYQWQKISGGVTNLIAGATNSTLTLTNLQTSAAAAYQLQASTVLGSIVSTPSSLTVNNVPGAVNNLVTAIAAQTGISGASSFVPTWTVASGSLIFGQSPNSVGSGSFTQGNTGAIGVLTDGTFGSLNDQPGDGSGPSEVACGGSAGQSVTYTLSGSGTGYTLTNLTVFGGWGDAGRDQQAYTVYYSKISAPMTFISLGSVNYNPANPASSLSGTRAILTAANGVLASNVVAVKFDFTTPAPENGYCGYSEINVLGTPTLEPLPAPWATADIGAVSSPGNANYSGGVFSITGSGAAIGGAADALRYVYQPVSGNCVIRARVTNLQNTAVAAKAGVMIRETLTAGAASALLNVTPGNGLEFITRPATSNNSTTQNSSGPSAPYWVQLVRNANTFTAYTSPDGATWTKLGQSQTIPMAATIYIGLAVCAENNGALATATFDNVTFPAPPGNVYTAPQLTVNSSGQNSSGTFTFQFSGVNDLNYTVQTSTNLTDWTAIYTNALTSANGGIFNYTDTSATNTAQFYRVSQ